jgi:hypothetical protein
MASQNSSRAKPGKNPFAAALCVLALLFAGGCAGPPKHPTWKNATGAEQYERLMWQAVRDKDWTNFEAHLAPTFVGVNQRGEVLDRAGWIAFWKSAQPADYSLGEVTVEPEGQDMVVTYVLSPSIATAQSGTELRVISVWQSTKHGWILISTSSTPIRP